VPFSCEGTCSAWQTKNLLLHAGLLQPATARHLQAAQGNNTSRLTRRTGCQRLFDGSDCGAMVEHLDLDGKKNETSALDCNISPKANLEMTTTTTTTITTTTMYCYCCCCCYISDENEPPGVNAVELFISEAWQ